MLLRVKDSHAVLHPGVRIPVQAGVAEEAVAVICRLVQWRLRWKFTQVEVQL